MLSIKGGAALTLQIVVQNKVAILIEAGQEASWAAGTLLAAVGMSVFSAKAASTFEGAVEALFHLQDSASQVIYKTYC